MEDIYFYITKEDGAFYLSCSHWEEGIEEEFSLESSLKSIIEEQKYYYDDHYSGQCEFYEVYI